MADPANGLTVSNLESFLTRNLQMPHNRDLLVDRRTKVVKTPQQRAHEIAVEALAGFVGVPEARRFAGPRKFVRGVGPNNLAFGGPWWFDEAFFVGQQQRLSSFPFSRDQLRALVHQRVREGLAISVDWNPLAEMWMLEIPAGESLTGLWGVTKQQPVYSVKHPQHDPTHILRGGVLQAYFPVRNPLWVFRY